LSFWVVNFPSVFEKVIPATALFSPFAIGWFRASSDILSCVYSIILVFFG
jgi:hypothetical protein